MSTAVAGTDRAWGWVDHLRAGGTTPWVAFADSPAFPGLSPDDAVQSRFIPGAQQLELLRRLNLAGRPSAALVERVLTASAPGRGRPDLELVGVDATRRFGPPPVDPATLSDPELLRVATGLLAEDVVAAPPPPAEPRPRRVRVRYELVGDPWLTPALTAALTSDGWPPGGAGRAVSVLGGPVPQLLAHSWAAACFGSAAPTWPDFLVRARRRLPRRIDLPRVLDRQLALPYAGQVALVLDLRALPRLVGVRRLPTVPEVGASAAELARLVGQALSLLVTPPEQTRLLGAVLRPRLAGLGGAPVVVPPEHAEWVEDAGHAMRQRVLRAGYPVVGDVDVLLAGSQDSPADRGIRTLSAVATPDNVGKRPSSVLDLAIRLLLEEAP